MANLSLELLVVKKRIQAQLKQFDACCIDYDIAENNQLHLRIEGIGTFILWDDGQYQIVDN